MNSKFHLLFSLYINSPTRGNIDKGHRHNIRNKVYKWLVDLE